MAIERLAVLCVASWLPLVGAAQATQTFTVNSALDEPDTDVGDGICRSASGVCTLRAAVMQANALTASAIVITVPPGTYTVTRPLDNAHPGSGGSFVLNAAPDGSTPISIVGTKAAATIID